MPIIVTPKPPVSTFERDSARATAAYATVVDVPIFVVQPERPGTSLGYPRVSAAVSKVNVTNLSGTTALVSARTVDFSFITYSATIVAGSGDGTDTLTLAGLTGAGITAEPNYRLFDMTDPDAPIRTTLGTNLLGQTSCDWSPDGRYLVTTGPTTNDRVQFYDFNTGVPVLVAPNPLTVAVQSVNVARFSPSGTHIAIGYGNGVVEIHPWPAGGAFVTLPSTPAIGVTGIAWRPSGRYLAVTHGQVSGLSIYDNNTGSWVKTTLPASNPEGFARHVAWSPNSRYLAVAHTGNARLAIYDWSSGSPVRLSNPATAAPVPSTLRDALAWSPNSRYVAQAGAVAPFVRVYDLDTGSPVALADLPTVALGTGTNCIWSPDGGTLILGYAVSADDEFTDITYLVNYAFDGAAFTPLDPPNFLTQSTARAMAWNSTRNLLHVVSFGLPGLNGPSLDNVRLLDNLGVDRILNGSFEDTTGMTPTTYGFVGDVPNWICVDGSDVAKTRRVYTNNKRGIIASDGIAWLDMLGGGDLSDPLSVFAWTLLKQTVAGLTPGASYTLRFDAAMMSQASGLIRVLWNGAEITLTSSLGQTVAAANPLGVRTILRNISIPAGQATTLPLAKTIMTGGDLLQVQSVGADCDVSASYVLIVTTD